MQNGRWLSALLFCVIGCAGAADDGTSADTAQVESSAEALQVGQLGVDFTTHSSASASALTFSCGISNCKGSCVCQYRLCLAEGEAFADCVRDRNACLADCAVPPGE